MTWAGETQVIILSAVRILVVEKSDASGGLEVRLWCPIPAVVRNAVAERGRTAICGSRMRWDGKGT